MSETLKLIIEIDENTYKDTKKGKVYSSMRDVPQESVLAIAHGIPLDDVKAEIEKQIERDFAFAETETLKVPCHYGIANGLQNAIRFIDNIWKGDINAKET